MVMLNVPNIGRAGCFAARHP